MMTDLNWTKFCELYFTTAKKYAEFHLQSLIARNGKPDKRVDQSYVVDAAVLAGLEKTYTHFNAARGAKITTFLSRVVHNAVVDEFNRESKAAAQQDDIDVIRTGIKEFSDDMTPGEKEALIARMMKAIERLSPSDQVILHYWLEDKPSYVARSAETLGVSTSYVTMRRFRIFKALPKLMDMTREEYLCSGGFFDISPNSADMIHNDLRNIHDGSIMITSTEEFDITEVSRTRHPNPILPVNLKVMAERLTALRSA